MGAVASRETDVQPFTHDILAALGLLDTKDDGNLEFETFNHAVGSSQSDNGTTTSVFDGDIALHDPHDSIADQCKSPALSSEDTVARSPGSTNLGNHFMASIEALLSLDPNTHSSPENIKQTQHQTKLTHNHIPCQLKPRPNATYRRRDSSPPWPQHPSIEAGTSRQMYTLNTVRGSFRYPWTPRSSVETTSRIKPCPRRRCSFLFTMNGREAESHLTIVTSRLISTS